MEEAVFNTSRYSTEDLLALWKKVRATILEFEISSAKKRRDETDSATSDEQIVAGTDRGRVELRVRQSNKGRVCDFSSGRRSRGRNRGEACFSLGPPRAMFSGDLEELAYGSRAVPEAALLRIVEMMSRAACIKGFYDRYTYSYKDRSKESIAAVKEAGLQLRIEPKIPASEKAKAKRHEWEVIAAKRRGVVKELTVEFDNAKSRLEQAQKQLSAAEEELKKWEKL